jgi:hypothetical protein
MFDLCRLPINGPFKFASRQPLSIFYEQETKVHRMTSASYFILLFTSVTPIVIAPG